MRELPSGTVTFLFSDVEGSTQLLERHGRAMGAALARHHALFEEVVERHQGAIFETVGDAVYAAFSQPQDALASALDVQLRLAHEDFGGIGPIAVRIALHTGAVERRGDHYFGPALFRCARLQAIGHGGQTLVTGVTAQIAADGLPEGAQLLDVGQHRLKDLAKPEQVFQLVHPDLRAEFPPLQSLDFHPHNLPVQPDSFVGRERELAEVADLLQKHRLISLLGPGGVGKTRLALQVAADHVTSFGDGSWFVDLAPLRDPGSLPGAIAAVLGLREQSGRPVLKTLSEHLSSRNLLLILDNFEQLLPAGIDSIAKLLANTSELRIVVTSRAALRVRGERQFPVAPLPSANGGDPGVPAAVQLLMERGRSVRPGLVVTPETARLMAAICERLDGLPLAIELAASRLRLFDLSQLHERLAHRLPLLKGGPRDVPARQQTLRDAIAWSEELLSTSQQRLLRQLSVFAGGFSLDAVESVAIGDSPSDVLEDFATLIEHFLVRPPEGDPPRYTMLESVCEYARERLEEAGEEKRTRDRHAAYYVRLADELRPELESAGQIEALRRLRAERDNFRTALDHLFGEEPAEHLRLIHALLPAWLHFDGRLDECDAALRRAARLVESLPAKSRALWHLDLGHVELARGDARQATSHLEQVLEGDRAALGREYLVALRGLALAAREREDLDDAQRYIDACLTQARESGELLEAGHALLVRARIALRRATYDVGIRDSQSAIDVLEQAGDVANVGRARLELGTMLEYINDLAAARLEYEAALRAFEAVSDEIGAAEARMSLGYLEFLAGDHESAIREIVAGAEQFESSGWQLELVRALTTLAVVLGEGVAPALAAKVAGWSQSELDRLGVRWRAEKHAESVPKLNILLDLQKDAKWEAERIQGRNSTALALLAEARSLL